MKQLIAFFIIPIDVQMDHLMVSITAAMVDIFWLIFNFSVGIVA